MAQGVPALVTCMIACMLTTVAGCISVDATGDRRAAIDLAQSRVDGSTEVRGLEEDPHASPRAWDGTSPLDADTAVQVALQRDAAVRRTLALVDLARANLAQEDRAPNPTLGLNVGVPIDGISGGPALAMIAQQMTWLWTRTYRVGAADAMRRAAILEAASAAVDLDAEIRSLHARAIAARDLAAIDRDFATLTARSTSLVQRRLDAGEASPLDLDRAEVEAREADVAARARQATARASRLSLLAAMGIPTGSTDFELDGMLDDGAETIPEESLVIALSATARMDVAARGMELLAAESRTGLAETRRLPEVTATLNWTKNFNDRKALSPGVQLTIPILDDGTPAIAAAEAEVRASALSLLATQRAAIARARTVREDLIVASLQAKGYRDRVLEPALLAEHRAELAYEEGVSDLTVLLLAQQRRIGAQRKTIEHRLQTTVDRIALARAVGGTLDLEPLAPDVPPIEASGSASNPEVSR